MVLQLFLPVESDCSIYVKKWRRELETYVHILFTVTPLHTWSFAASGSCACQTVFWKFELLDRPSLNLDWVCSGCVHYPIVYIIIF